MAYPNLALAPLEAGYTVDFDRDDAVRSQDLMGGGPRMKRDLVGSTARVTVRWRLDINRYERLMAFYRHVPHSTGGRASAANPFTIDLILDYSYPTSYLAKFVPGSLRLDETSGTRFTVSAELEVEPLDIAPEIDTAFVDIYELYGDDGALLLELLAELVNEDLP